MSGNFGRTAEKQVNDANCDVNIILKQIGGTRGRFQIRNFLLYSIGLCFCGMASMSYVFTAMNNEYRFVYNQYNVAKNQAYSH